MALLSGGGSGHEPLHAGFVGRGMLDAACPGQIFTSPTPDQIVEAAAAVGGMAGVLFIVKNYAGDRMNFEWRRSFMRARRSASSPMTTFAVEKSTHSDGRRGVAGTLVVEKIVGAAAEKGMDLQMCAGLAADVNARTRSIGVALTSCTVPAAGTPTFALGEDEMEMGVGKHGEPGRKRIKLGSADGVAEQMVGAILADHGGGASAARSCWSMDSAARRRWNSTDVQCRAAYPARARHHHCALAGWLLRDVSRDGRLLDQLNDAR